MSIPAHDLCLTVDEYLKLEETATERHEYVAGRVFAMVGATQAHNVIVANFCRHLYDPVKKVGCRVFASDMKLRIEATNSFYYPDIMVTCEPFSAGSVYTHSPCLIVEVMSPSTQDVDRREKLTAYRHLPSLLEYVLVHQNKMQIEVYRKDNKGEWHCNVFSGAAKLPLIFLSDSTVELSMQDIYYGTDAS